MRAPRWRQALATRLGFLLFWFAPSALAMVGAFALAQRLGKSSDFSELMELPAEILASLIFIPLWRHLTRFAD